jgi:hypothetical protein
MLFNGGIGKEAQMIRRDLLLVVSTAVISSLLTYYIVATRTAPPEALRYESSAANGNHAADLGQPDFNTGQIKPSKQELDTAGALQQGSIQPRSEDRSNNSTSQYSSIALQKQQELEEQFSNLFSGGSNPDSGALNARIEGRFYLEDWNQEWAASKERNIRTLFEVNEDLSGVAPLQVACRSKNCQVVLAAANQAQVRLLSEKFMQAATKGDVGMKDKVVSFFPDVSTGRVVFYLSENRNTDLFQ